MKLNIRTEQKGCDDADHPDSEGGAETDKERLDPQGLEAFEARSSPTPAIAAASKIPRLSPVSPTIDFHWAAVRIPKPTV